MPAPLQWVLEKDDVNPGLRYFALKELLNKADNDLEVKQAQEAVMSTGPVPIILQKQEPEGFWAKAGASYGPNYRGTLRTIIFLAQLGADGSHEQIRAGCEYILAHYPAKEGGLSGNAKNSFLIHCMQGNLVAALIDLGMKYSYNGKTWVDIEEKHRPSKWVTLRALRVLKKAK